MAITCKITKEIFKEFEYPELKNYPEGKKFQLVDDMRLTI